MKKNLISALIPWMLYFLTGCYTTTDLTSKDLIYHHYETITFVDGKYQSYALRKFTDSSDALSYIENHPGCLTCTKWVLGIDSISLECAGIKDITGDSVFTTNNYQLSAGELSEMKSVEFDQTSTILLGIALVLGIILIVAACSIDMGGYDLKGFTLVGP